MYAGDSAGAQDVIQPALGRAFGSFPKKLATRRSDFPTDPYLC